MGTWRRHSREFKLSVVERMKTSETDARAIVRAMTGRSVNLSVDKSPARPSAGIIDHHIRRPAFALDQTKQALDLVGICRIAGIGARAGFRTQRAELFDAAGRQRDANAFAREQPRQRGAQARAGADDQGLLVFGGLHRMFLVLSGTGVLVLTFVR